MLGAGRGWEIVVIYWILGMRLFIIIDYYYPIGSGCQGHLIMKNLAEDSGDGDILP